MLIRALLSVSLAAFTIAPAVADEPKKPADPAAVEIKVGMRIKSLYAGSWYKGTIKEIKDKNTYVIRSDGTTTDSTVAASRLQTEDGVDFLDIIKDPQRVAQRARDKKTGTDYFVGLWNASAQPVWVMTDSVKKTDGTIVETYKINLGVARGMVLIKEDNTYEHSLYGKEVTKGAWVESADKKAGGIVLKKAHILGGDLRVFRRDLGSIFLQREEGGAGHDGVIVMPKTEK